MYYIVIYDFNEIYIKCTLDFSKMKRYVNILNTIFVKQAISFPNMFLNKCEGIKKKLCVKGSL